MIESFLEVFPSREKCVTEISNKHSFVYEHPDLKKGVFVNDNEIFHVHIENDSFENYHFVQNDDCVMKSVKGGQCDYVVFNKEIIHFIEVKASKGTLKTISSLKKDVYKQLENTFKFYMDFLEKFENRFALACFENVNHRGYTKRKIPQSSKSEKKLLFKMKYNIELLEGNFIKFD
jgi:Holliday junction resolvase-like predicted endonuclease